VGPVLTWDDLFEFHEALAQPDADWWILAACTNLEP
jgi:hypothetical protein